MSVPAARPHVVVVGGGFAGLAAARILSREPVRVTLVDRRNHHLFQPLLYQVATAALSPAEIAMPLRSIFRKARTVKVLLAEVEKIDLAGRRVVLDEGDLDYDALVLAREPGTRTSATPTGSASPPGSRPSRTRSRSAAGSCSRSRRPSARRTGRSAARCSRS